MSTDYEAQIAALRARITAAQRERIRNEHARDAAQASAQQARQRLADEFGVEDLVAARALHARLEQELAETIQNLTAALDDLGV